MFAQGDLSAVVIVYFLAVWLISLSNKSEVQVSSVEFYYLISVVSVHELAGVCAHSLWMYPAYKAY